jgi:phosphoribosylanthranilate isomerase
LLNFDKGGFNWNDVQNGEILNAGIVQDFCQRFPILLGIGIQASELPSMLEYLQPAGLHLLGGEEEKTGVKSFDDVDELFEALSLG